MTKRRFDLARPQSADDLTRPDLRYLELAKQNDLEPLAEYIERGGELHPDTRYWLADYLRGEINFPKHRPRTQQKKLDDFRIWRAVEKEKKKAGITTNAAYEIVAALLTEQRRAHNPDAADVTGQTVKNAHLRADAELSEVRQSVNK